ncbi:cell wall hydrolase [Sphingomonas abietis]|uniref:Cell wall hydrolase n=1 Tax=Sphingomonas abietis TaxID=3012344 RepID=A0ABY7NHY2_9SPHN|nr:cell wall hydrolase [Sphingomonas abietis]WBO21094.1 cell wall hydrolase [Sphingomonas abietis]
MSGALSAAPSLADAPAPRLSYTLVGLDSAEALSWSHGRAAAPFSAAAPSRAPSRAVRAPTASDGDLACLATAIYYEARSEAEDGQRAVAQVVLNRVNRPSFARSVCGVVHQRGATGCQFKFFCDGSLREPRENRAWSTALRIARSALGGDIFPRIGAATFYHTAAVSPGWSQRLTRVAVIGAHIFYSARIG